MKSKRVLLHICCGVCALASIEYLKENGFSVTGFFFNPNIHPYSEYLKRKKAAYIAARFAEIGITEGRYSVSDWFGACKSLSYEKEGFRRCLVCYRLRLEGTYNLCREEGFDYFTTTLTISPHKVSATIFDIGKQIGKEKFLDVDFKKKDGFKKSVQAAKSMNIYSQKYCGCVYSLYDCPNIQ